MNTPRKTLATLAAIAGFAGFALPHADAAPRTAVVSGHILRADLYTSGEIVGSHRENISSYAHITDDTTGRTYTIRIRNGYYSLRLPVGHIVDAEAIVSPRDGECVGTGTYNQTVSASGTVADVTVACY